MNQKKSYAKVLTCRALYGLIQPQTDGLIKLIAAIDRIASDWLSWLAWNHCNDMDNATDNRHEIAYTLIAKFAF